ncbi:chaplin [Streptomyces rhizosphaerihabitans]|uniref:chaplin n=1 Tax=Streptomyces rhizosphaerihabitans TaxID=1266770 RepID=UPI0028F6D502|nr:chaplin [Streptomyces rhizosphaerihabitans]
MKRVTRNGLIAAAAASGALAAVMPAHADSAANGTAAGSPGVISGNTVQLPLHVPVNLCGNTVDVAGLFNPAAGNRCADVSAGGGTAASGGGRHGGARGHSGGGAGGGGAHGGGVTGGGAVAHGGGKDSPGVLSGNGLQLPVDLPVNVSGNSVTVVGLGNASVGNESVNASGGKPRQPHHLAKPAPRPSTQPAVTPETGARGQVRPQSGAVASLAHTGADQTMPAIAASAALLLGGAVLYRRFRPAAVR